MYVETFQDNNVLHKNLIFKHCKESMIFAIDNLYNILIKINRLLLLQSKNLDSKLVKVLFL